MKAYWDRMNALLPLLEKGGHIRITSSGREYVSVPWEHGVMFVCTRPYHVIQHFSVLDDPDAVATYIDDEEAGDTA